MYTVIALWKVKTIQHYETLYTVIALWKVKTIQHYECFEVKKEHETKSQRHYGSL